MPQTTRDKILQEKAKRMYDLHKDKPEIDVIHEIMSFCNVTQRTAKDYYLRYKNQRVFSREACPHTWSSWFSTTSGLRRECLDCRSLQGCKLVWENDTDSEPYARTWDI